MRWRRALWPPRAMPAWIASSSALPTRTSRKWSPARASCNSIDAAKWRTTSRPSSRSSVFRRNRFPITSRSLGDAADGYPGLPGWGPKSSAAVLARFRHLESIPPDVRDWHVDAANAGGLSRTLNAERDRAMLFRTLATLRTDIALFESVDELEWHDPSLTQGTPLRRFPMSETGSVSATQRRTRSGIEWMVDTRSGQNTYHDRCILRRSRPRASSLSRPPD